MLNKREILIKEAAQILLKQRQMEKIASGNAWKHLFKYLGLANLVGIPMAYGMHKSNVNKAREEGGMLTYQRLMPWMMAMYGSQGNLSSPYSFQNQGLQQSSPTMMG